MHGCKDDYRFKQRLSGSGAALFFAVCLLFVSLVALAEEVSDGSSVPADGSLVPADGSLIPADGSSTLVVAFSQDDMKNDFRRAQVFAIREGLAPYKDIRFIHSDAQGKVALQIHQIRQLTQDGVDILVVGASDSVMIAEAVEEAYQQGVKVLLLDRGVVTTQYTSVINSDNYLVGQLAGRFIAEQLQGEGEVLLMEGLPGADVTRDRTEGFLSVVQAYPKIRVQHRVGNYLRKDALIEMEKLLTDGISVDAIFSASDSMLSGVRAALEHHRVSPGSMITVGVDYISEAREAIQAGTQTASVVFPLGADATVDAILRLKAGKPLARHIAIRASVLVTADNVDQIEPVF